MVYTYLASDVLQHSAACLLLCVVLAFNSEVEEGRGANTSNASQSLPTPVNRKSSRHGHYSSKSRCLFWRCSAVTIYS